MNGIVVTKSNRLLCCGQSLFQLLLLTDLLTTIAESYIAKAVRALWMRDLKSVSNLLASTLEY